MESAVATSEEAIAAIEKPSKVKVVAKIFFWAFVTLSCLLVFTLIKLPDAKLKNVIQSHISAALDPYGITLSSEDASFSVLMGIRYKLKKARIYLPPPSKEIVFDEIAVSPSFLPLLKAQLGAGVKITNDKGSFLLSASFGKTSGSLSFDLSSFDIGKAQLAALISKLAPPPSSYGSMGGPTEAPKIGAVLSGNGSFSLDLSDLKKMDGETNLTLKNIVIDAQTISLNGIPLSIPQMTISEGQIVMVAKSGKLAMRNVRLGKSGSLTDDVQLALTGDIGLEKNWNSSKLNLTARFKFSEKTLKAFPLLNGLLASGKQSDGDYAFVITGSPGFPQSQPLK